MPGRSKHLTGPQQKLLNAGLEWAAIQCSPSDSGEKVVELLQARMEALGHLDTFRKWYVETDEQAQRKKVASVRRRLGRQSTRSLAFDARKAEAQARVRQLEENEAAARRAFEEQEERARLAEARASETSESARGTTEQRGEWEKRADEARAIATQERERALLLGGLWKDAETKLRIERKLAPLGPYHARLEWFHKTWGLIDAFAVSVVLGIVGIVAALYVLSLIGYLSTLVAVAGFGLGAGALTTFLVIYGVLIVKLRRPKQPLIGPLLRQVNREDGKVEWEPDL